MKELMFLPPLQAAYLKFLLSGRYKRGDIVIISTPLITLKVFFGRYFIMPFQ